GQKTVREIAEEIAEHYRVDSEHVVRDLLALCGQLLMSDVIYLKRYSDWRTRFLTQDFSGMLRRLFLPRRQDIESANLAGILWEIGGVVLRSWWFLLLFFGMTGVFLSQVTGDKRFFWACLDLLCYSFLVTVFMRGCMYLCCVNPWEILF